MMHWNATIWSSIEKCYGKRNESTEGPDRIPRSLMKIKIQLHYMYISSLYPGNKLTVNRIRDVMWWTIRFSSTKHASTALLVAALTEMHADIRRSPRLFRYEIPTRRCAGRPAAGLWGSESRTEVSSRLRRLNRPNSALSHPGPPLARPRHGAPPCSNWRNGRGRGVSLCCVHRQSELG